MSFKINIYNQNGEKIGGMNLSDKIFSVEPNEVLLHQAMVVQMANERQVLAHTKDRSEVRGGGKKPWRQKGTGRARAGSNRSPIWIGGGVTFGPRKTRNFKKDINKKMKQKALFMVLSDRAKNKNLVVLDKIEMKEFKTKIFNDMIKKIEVSVLASSKEDKPAPKLPSKRGQSRRSILVINKKKDDKVKFSGRNLEGVKIINQENINILDLLKFRNLIMPASVVKDLEKTYIK